MTAARVIRETADLHGITVDQLTSRARGTRLVTARIDAANRLRIEYGLGPGRIGQLLGRTYWQALYYVDAAFRDRQRAKSRAVMARLKAAA